MNCLTVDVGLEEGVKVGFDVVGTDVGMELDVADVGLKEGVEVVGFDVVGTDVGMELGIADGCAGMICMFRGYHEGSK